MSQSSSVLNHTQWEVGTCLHLQKQTTKKLAYSVTSHFAPVFIIYSWMFFGACFSLHIYTLQAFLHSTYCPTSFFRLPQTLLLLVAGISSTASCFGSQAATLACFANLSTFVWCMQALLSPQKTESNSIARNQAELAPQIDSPTKKCL